MPFDENGNFTRLYGATGWQDDRDANTNILASRHDDDGNDTAAALNQAFLADGRKTASGPFKMGGYRVKGLGDGQEAQDAPTVKQVQSGTFNYGADVSQEANALKVNLAPAPQSLPQGMFLWVKVAHSNTGKTTLQLNTLPAKPVYLNDQDLCEGMLQAGQVYIFFYNKVLDAFQLLPTGAPVGAAVPPFTLIVLDHLLSGDAAIGWELQGTRCYKSKYWEQYQQLAKEYAEAVERTEEVEGEQFAYKVNLTTLRRFYTKNAYDQRFALCGDSGGYVLLMLLQPVVLAVAKLTKTQKDDAFWAKVYDFLTDFGPCFKPVAELFKKRTGWPETAAGSEDTGSRTRDEVK